MLNPYKEAAPWARAITLCVLGAAAFYLLGRWEVAVDRELEQLREETSDVIDHIHERRAWTARIKALEDSLQAVDDSLVRQVRATEVALAANTAADSQAVLWADTASVDSLLSVLRMRPLKLGDTTFYVATERRARVLADRLLRLPIAQARILEMGNLVRTQSSRITILDRGWDAARLRGDTLEADLSRITPLLEAWQDYSNCKILGVISCPSRTTAAVVGGLAGGLAIYFVSRE